MSSADEKTCPACGASNVGNQENCLLCGKPLEAPPASPTRFPDQTVAESDDEGMGQTLWKLLLAGLVIGAIVLGLNMIGKLIEKKEEHPRPTWEQWHLEPRPAPGEFVAP